MCKFCKLAANTYYMNVILTKQNCSFTTYNLFVRYFTYNTDTQTWRKEHHKQIIFL